MAWTIPVTDRPNAQTRTTAADINRICGNINYLWGTLLKTDFASTDIVTDTTWNGVITATNGIADLLGMNEVTANTDYANLNRIEAIALAYKELGPLWPADDLYPSEDLYPR